LGNTWTRQRFLTERPARKGAVGAGAGEHFRFGRASPGGIGAVPVSMDPAFLSPRCGFLKSEADIVAAARLSLSQSELPVLFFVDGEPDAAGGVVSAALSLTRIWQGGVSCNKRCIGWTTIP
jgi:hypothetical protein